jgi:hypothetical protein
MVLLRSKASVDSSWLRNPNVGKYSLFVLNTSALFP